MKSNPYDYRRRLPHLQKFDSPMFVTFCKLLSGLLSDEARSLVLDHCKQGHGRMFTLHAVVVMPDHVHLLLTPLRDAEGWPFPLQEIMKRIKGASARTLNKLHGVKGPVWQEESFDHVLRSNESLAEKKEYLRQNPVRRGLVQKPEDYQWLWLEK